MRPGIRTSALLFLAYLAADPAKAASSPWDLCATVGYFMGSPSLFLAGLADRLAERNQVNCLADQRQAYFVGKETAALVFGGDLDKADPGNFTEKQHKAFDNAVRFQEQVNDAILMMMNSPD
jgi:hypothetical protein